MKRYSKILLCAVLTTALLSFLAVSCLGASPSSKKYYVADSSSLYSSMKLKVTQYLTDGIAEGNVWNGLELSKTFYASDGDVNYVPSNGNYEINFYPFRNGWYIQDDLVYGDGGFFQYDISIPFEDSSGHLFDIVKLNESAYVNKVALYFNSLIANNSGYVDKRGFSCYIELADGGKVFLKQDSNDIISSQDFTILEDTNIKASDIVSFHFEFRYYGLPSSNSLFQFTIAKSSYLSVIDYNAYQDSVISNNNNSIDNVQNQVDSIVGDLDSPKPNVNDVNSALNGIDIGAVDSFGSLVGVNSSAHRNFQRFILAISVSVLGVAFIGYVLHGKRG